MSKRSLATALVATSMPLCAALPAPAAGAGSSARAGVEGEPLRGLVNSKELWATIDVCDPPAEVNTVGVRGSMPGDGRARDQMFMSFRLQYQDATSGQWLDLPSPIKPVFVRVGAGASVRQGGRSFQLAPQAGKPAFMLRGLVVFQWRRAGRVIQSASRPTTAGHRSRAGADPPGYSSAGCLIG